MHDKPGFYDAYQLPMDQTYDAYQLPMDQTYDAYQLPMDETLHPSGRGTADPDHMGQGQNGFLLHDPDQSLTGQIVDVDWEQELAQLLEPSIAAAEPGYGRVPRPRQPHRRRRTRGTRQRRVWPWLRVISFSLAALTCSIMTTVSVFGAMVSYDPLRHLAGSGLPPHLARGWPLLVFGPWAVASLSVLRATVHRRSALHAWLLVVFFSAVAVTLSVSHAPKTLSAIATAALPPVAALACFHQFIHQLTLTRPRHALTPPDATPSETP